jgi:signal transduction histidine kinase
LLIGFSIIELFLLVLVFSINYFFADDFYVKNSTELLISSIKEAKLEYYPTDLLSMTNNIAKVSGSAVHLIRTDFPPNAEGVPPVFNQAPVSEVFDKNMLERSLADMKEEADKLDGETYVTVTQGIENDNKSRFILSCTKLNDKTYIITNSGLGVIDGVFSIYSSFLFFSLIIVYIFGSLAIWFYAETFSKPLKRLSKRTERVSKMDFTGELLVSSKRGDEIDQLIESVNTMEAELSKAVNELTVTNHKLGQELAKEKDIDILRNRFLSDVSHELKNPLSIILGYSEALDKKIITNEEDKRYYIEVIHNECLRMSRLVKDLLNLSRLSAPGFKVEPEDCDLVTLITETFYNYKKAFSKKGTNVEYDLPESLHVSLDPIRFSQILTNLFDNALKHVDKNGTVGISLKEGTTPEGFSLEVSNTGDLIPKEEQSRIWEGFYQIDTDTKGTGLGLTIVKQLVELHDADISLWVDDRNRFRITR